LTNFQNSCEVAQLVLAPLQRQVEKRFQELLRSPQKQTFQDSGVVFWDDHMSCVYNFEVEIPVSLLDLTHSRTSHPVLDSEYSIPLPDSPARFGTLKRGLG
jgi:hypothetical protein